MYPTNIKLYLFIIISIIITGCNIANNTTKRDYVNSVSMNESTRFAGPQAIVYKTIRDFSDYIPVIMDQDKLKIISYPDPIDVYHDGNLAKPTKLIDGYLLDNRGINENVVFLNYTYEEYSKMTEAPSMLEMYSNIKEKYPLKEFIYCGNRTQFKNEIEELNAFIRNGFEGCKRIKILSLHMEI